MCFIKYKFFICLALNLVYIILPAFSSEIIIRKIYIDRHEVFDSTRKDWFFAAKLANALHFTTMKYIIEDELLFSEGDAYSEELLLESERNLRAKGLFTKVKIELDSVDEDVCDAYVITQDRWSTRPAVLFGTGGFAMRYGGRIEELNLAGTGTILSLEALHRKENSIGWQGRGILFQPRLFRTDFSLNIDVQSNKYRTDQYLMLDVPYRTLSHQYSYGGIITNNYGSDFLFNSEGGYELMPFHERDYKAWFSRAWRNIDRVFFTVLLDYNDVNRGKPEFRRAYDNSGKVLISFSSVSQNFIKTTKLNSYMDEDIAIGGWGSAILGKTFPIGSKGEGLYYVGGEGEISYLFDKLYLFGRISGASSFANSQAYYTYQDFTGKGFYRFSPNYLIAARVNQQTVWNWYALRQLILDNDFGLRGYPANSFEGDNRMFFNLEFRAFPDLPLWIFNFGGTLFWDTGTAWNRTMALVKTRWHNSIGAGIRFFDMKSTGGHGIFRVDFAYNLDEKRFGEIIITTDQFFSIFESHDYKLPEIFGLEFDYE